MPWVGRRGGKAKEGVLGQRVPQVVVFGDRLLDADLDLLEGGLVGCGEGGAVFVAGLLGLCHRLMW